MGREGEIEKSGRKGKGEINNSNKGWNAVPR
jgi:hypothetical protein